MVSSAPNRPQMLRRTGDEQIHVKTLVRTEQLRGIDYTPHAAECSGPACNTRGENVLPYAIQPTECHDVMVVNHYFTKSREDWEFKRCRGRGDSLEPARVSSITAWPATSEKTCSGYAILRSLALGVGAVRL